MVPSSRQFYPVTPNYMSVNHEPRTGGKKKYEDFGVIIYPKSSHVNYELEDNIMNRRENDEKSMSLCWSISGKESKSDWAVERRPGLLTLGKLKPVFDQT